MEAAAHAPLILGTAVCDIAAGAVFTIDLGFLALCQALGVPELNPIGTATDD